MEKVRDSGVLTLYCLIVFYLSAQPKLPVQDFFPHQDKLIHFLAYSVMGILAWRAFRHFIGRPSRLAACCIAFCGFYGLSDEIHQYYVPGRSADPYDLVADIIGAAVAVFLIRVFEPGFAVTRSLLIGASPPSSDREC